jgi:hypothetical protein
MCRSLGLTRLASATHKLADETANLHREVSKKPTQKIKDFFRDLIVELSSCEDGVNPPSI